MTRAHRTAPAVRKQLILEAAIKLSVKQGYNTLTRDRIAEEAEISSPLVSNYFPTMRDMTNAVIRAAIDRQIMAILAQLIILKDRRIKSLSEDTKRKVTQYISNL